MMSGVLYVTLVIRVYFNFATMRERMTFWNVDSTLIIQALKCWIATLIPYRSLESLSKYYKYVENFLTFSHACKGIC